MRKNRIDELNYYLQLSTKHGATHVKILKTTEVILDYRAYYKCIVPKCQYYNTSANCPPYAPSFESTKKLLSCFHYAILIGLRVSAVSILEKNQNVKRDLSPSKRVLARRKLSKILNLVEAEAFYNGNYFSTAFGSGSCKGTWCINLPCQALEKGESCRYPLLARPAMEGVGMDVFKIVSNAGWNIYPIGKGCKIENVPYGMFVGIVFIC